MQSNRLNACALPNSLDCANQNKSCGCKSAGHTSAQRVQRMHGMTGGGGGNIFFEDAMMQLVAFTSGTCTDGSGKPIIGPPMM